MRKVLIANRGEIAVRIVRACRDAGLASVAVYGEADLDALHVTMADEAYALGGQSAAESYLDIAQDPAGRCAAQRRGRRASRLRLPGRERRLRPRRHRRRADLDRAAAGRDRGARGQGAGAAHRQAGRRAARAGTDGPVSGADEAAAFAAEYGLPIAIKAAFGGGGRGLKVARTTEEIASQFESAVREAVAAFGRGECFVERYLDKPRHVETQCLADAHGNVVIVSTRDCSLQRRHQKLVEEAPAPFLTAEQDKQLRTASADILRAAGYVGAGTCEFLSARTAPSPSSRSTPASRSSTRSPRRSAASTWSGRCSGSPTASR